MKKQVFRRESRIRASAEAVHRWHARPEALADLIPPFQDVRILERTGRGIEDGSRVVLSIPAGPFRRRWVAEHRPIDSGLGFRDVMVKGPFRHWEHTHRFEPDGPDACRLTDEIEYALPMGFLGRWLGGRFVRKMLECAFAWRHERTREALEDGAEPANCRVC